MDAGVIAALVSAGGSVIVGGLTLIGVLVSNSKSNRAITAKIEQRQAVSDTKLDELTREVRTHNDFATRVPVLEAKIKSLEAELKELSKRVDKYHIPG